MQQQTRNLSNVLHKRDSQLFQFYQTKTKITTLLKTENVLLNLIWTNCQFFASIYSNTNSHQPICKNSNLNLANSTKLVVFRVNFTPAQGHSTQVPFVPLMTNFMRLNKWLNLFKCILGLTSKLCVLCTSDNHRIVFAVCSFAPTTGCRNRLVTFLVAWKVAAGKRKTEMQNPFWMRNHNVSICLNILC